jgi:hypothetical protein
MRLSALPEHSRNEHTVFIDLLQDRLSRIEDGAVIITKQDNRIVQVTSTELYSNLQAGKASAADVHNKKRKAAVCQYDFALLLEFLDGIRFGTVTLHIKCTQIVGVEKNEKIKL